MSIPREQEVLHATITTQVLHNIILNMRGRENTFVKGPLRNFTSKFLDLLEHIEIKEYDKFFNKAEESVDEIYHVYNDFLMYMSAVPTWDMQNIVYMAEFYYKFKEQDGLTDFGEILKAYQADKKSLMGIAKKINKYNEQP